MDQTGISWARLPVTCPYVYTCFNTAMAAGWSNEETKALLGIWGAADVQSQLDRIVRNKMIATVLCDLPETLVSSLSTLSSQALSPGSILAVLLAN